MQAFVKDFRAVIKNRKNHFYHEVRCVYARKPFPHEIVDRGGEGSGGRGESGEEEAMET